MHGLLLMLLVVSVTGQAASFKKPLKRSLEVRVLVDVSERMGIADPEHYRLAALKLFVELLPNKALAGIWTFDEMTTPIIKPGKASEIWKNQALKKLTGLSSTTKRSDLERALAVATFDWVGQEDDVSRHLILITNGNITSGGLRSKNLASKKRILSHQISRLKEAGVTVHTVAISDTADQELLESLASQTHGWFEEIKQERQLERALLRINQRLVERNSIPVVANKFDIDETVREFTAVVFRKKGFGSTQLDDPEGMDFGKTSQRSGVRWHREKKFDIVTVKKPMAGEWRLIAAADPNNTIFIKTNLQMAIEKAPKEVIEGSDFQVRMLITEKGKLMLDEGFLALISATVEVKNKRGEKELFDFTRDMINGGYFFADIGSVLKPGPYEATVRASGSTFERVGELSFYVSKKPKVEYLEVKPIFKEVIAEAGITLDKQGVTKEQLFECPDLSKILLSDENSQSCLASNDGSDESADKNVGDEDVSWVISLLIVLLVTVLLAATSFFGFKYFQKKGTEEDEALIKELLT